MSGGSGGLTGYVYQQHYLAFRVLSSIATAGLDDGALRSRIVTFSVEGRGSPEAPAWDVRFETESGDVHLRECKDTAITADDRKVFYRRIRAELASGTDPNRLYVGWVTDPDKQGTSILTHFAGIPPLAMARRLPGHRQCPARVESASRALAEGLHFLRAGPARGAGSLPPCSLANARMVFSRLTVEEHRFEELAEALELLALGVFDGGTAVSLRTFITGTLTEQVTTAGSASYTTEGFVRAVGAGAASMTLPRELSRLLRFCSMAGFAGEIPSIKWSQLPGDPVTRWPLEARIPGDRPASYTLLAGAGIGKSVSCAQMAAEQAGRLDPHHVLRVEARGASRETVRNLPELACLLAGLGPSWIGIDGLDEVRRDDQALWEESLDRLLRLPGLTVVATAREEVVAAHPWLQSLTDRLPAIRLAPLSESQVEEAFTGANLPLPANRRLLEVLRVPLHLSLYARLVTPSDMPFSSAGEVTGLQVIETFWHRAVGSLSLGHRAVVDEDLSQHPKAVAGGWLIRSALSGVEDYRLEDMPPQVGTGVEMLIREGVLVRRGVLSVGWVHRWVLEFGLIEHLTSGVDSASPEALADAVLGVAADSTRRIAAVAGLKWALAKPGWGRPENYLAALYSRGPGMASEALAVYLEQPADRLTLTDLPPPMILEATRQATYLKAPQWVGQVLALPLALFGGPEAPELHDSVTRYLTEVCVDG